MPGAFLEARFLAHVFESAKIGSVELNFAWFTYLPDAQDLANPRIFEVAVREGHVHLLQWLLAEESLNDEHMIANVPNSNAIAIEWLREHFPQIKLTISFDKLVERWTGATALTFMQTLWSQKKQYRKIEVSVYAKSMAAAIRDLVMLKWLDTIRKGKCHV